MGVKAEIINTKIPETIIYFVNLDMHKVSVVKMIIILEIVKQASWHTKVS